MLKLNRSNFQAHPFHLVSPSPWPLYTFISLLFLTTSVVLSFHGFCDEIYDLFNTLVNYLDITIISCDGPDFELVNHCDDPFGEPADPMPGRRCPTCLERGRTVWVIPGHYCRQCLTLVN